MKKIKLMTIQEYTLLLESGMFWEWYPEATGDYNKDRALSAQGKFKFEQSAWIDGDELKENRSNAYNYII